MVENEFVFMTSVESIPEVNLHEMSAVHFIVDSGGIIILLRREEHFYWRQAKARKSN